MRLLALFVLLCFSRLTFAKVMPCTLSQPHKDLQQIKNKIEDNPFILACKNPPGLLKDRPPSTNVFTMIQKDKNGRTTKDLLKKILARVRTRVEESKNQNANIQKCMNKAQPGCDELRKWMNEDLPLYVKRARYHLSLAQSHSQFSTWRSKVNQEPNENLELLGGYKYEPWVPLTEEEKKRARLELSTYKKEIPQKFPGLSKEEQSEKLLKARFDHYLFYTKLISELPLLQFLRGPSADELQLKVAFYEMNKKLDQESENLDRIERALNDSRGVQPQALELLRYHSFLEEELLADNQDCGLAASLVYNLNNTDLAKVVSVGLPILAASVFAPPTLAFMIGASAGVSMGYKSYADLLSSEEKYLGHIYGDSRNPEYKQLEKANDMRKFGVYTLPLGLGLGGFAGSYVVKALNSAKKINQIHHR